MVSIIRSILSRFELILSRSGFPSHAALTLKVRADLSTLVTISQFRNSTDQRDKIFALNNLMLEPFRIILAPDYRQSLRAVYTKMTTLLLCIRRWGKLYELFPVNSDKRSSSWVPDYSQHRPVTEKLGVPEKFRISTARDIDCWVFMGL